VRPRNLLQPGMFRKLVDRGVKEKSLQKDVEEALDVHGWWWMHVPSNVIVCPKCRWKIFRGIAKGFPDILAIRPPHILWIELKTETGQLRPDQRRVGKMLQDCGQTWIHARPRDREQLLAMIASPWSP
jgi:VRR-NUC domain